jgi:hypothetical protein
MPKAGILSPNIKNRNHTSPDTSVTVRANTGGAREHSVNTFAEDLDPHLRLRPMPDHVRASRIVV